MLDFTHKVYNADTCMYRLYHKVEVSVIYTPMAKGPEAV